MSFDLPRHLPELADLADRQCGVLTRRQAQSAGMSADLIRSRLERSRWQRLHTATFATFSGRPDRRALLWAAVLRAGPGAALSHYTAAELDGLLDRQVPLIHVTIPDGRRATAISGAVIHRSLGAERATHPTRLPPRTRIEETVLDLTNCSCSAGDAIGWITAALGRRLTTAERLRASADDRSRLRWRSDISRVLSPDLAGVHSWLEYVYHRDVERPHGLPVGRRQARGTAGGITAYRDVLYDEYALIVELDGRVAHPGDTRWLDIRRDNAAAADGLLTLRYGYRDVTTGACQVAYQVADVLCLRGWSGAGLRPCSPSCQVGQ